MATIKSRFALFLMLLCMTPLLCACGEAENKTDDSTAANKSSIFVYSDGIEIHYQYYDGLSDKKIEIDLSEEEIRTLVDALAAYDGKWLDDQLKWEVTSGYLIRFDEDTYARIGAKDDASSKDVLVYMYVKDQGKYKNVYIDSAIIGPLEAQRARAE